MYTLGPYNRALCTLKNGTHSATVELVRVDVEHPGSSEALAREVPAGTQFLSIRDGRGGKALAALVLDRNGNLLLFQPGGVVRKRGLPPDTHLRDTCAVFAYTRTPCDRCR